MTHNEIFAAWTLIAVVFTAIVFSVALLHALINSVKHEYNISVYEEKNIFIFLKESKSVFNEYYNKRHAGS